MWKADRNNTPVLRFHAYFILTHVSLKDRFSLAFGVSFSIHPSATHATDVEDENDDMAPNDIPL